MIGPRMLSVDYYSFIPNGLNHLFLGLVTNKVCVVENCNLNPRVAPLLHKLLYVIVLFQFFFLLVND